jgi:hypothetical protein
LNFTDLSKNQLSGSIPGSLFEIPSLTNLYLSNNAFTGFLPANYGNAASLRDFYTSNNFLSGEIPPIQPGQLTRLNEFLLDNNDFTGTMPVTICDLRTTGDLEDLWSDCRGSPPELICSLPDCCTACF